MNNIEELKLCPFCGGKAHLLTSNGSFLVECSLCLTDFLNGPVGIGWYRSEKDAAADWNDRPSERALIAQLEAAQKERDELRDKFNEMSVQKQFWVKCAKELESQLEKVEAELSAANEKLSKAVVLPSSFSYEHDDLPHSVAVLKKRLVIKAIKAAGFTVEGEATPIVIAPAPTGVVMRPQFENPLERCAAARDGECHHKDCPQLRDNEPVATGRHCPIDNWDDE
ncbi:Lar family restriction alleviation protein [Yersinia mollaretii]|uniref:Lar family restriction alleviation protein n=1 Tax=Yersinia mollaretii TaxID=33060 RepID=UPI00061C1420|nr:Lar family restriction alleviation protein [Yersinia mollaretii]CNJ56177.1 Uncharacterised protein [Yersinia mollaretii]